MQGSDYSSAIAVPAISFPGCKNVVPAKGTDCFYRPRNENSQQTIATDIMRLLAREAFKFQTLAEPNFILSSCPSTT